MSLSPTLESFLAGMEYPATKDDLVREAARDGLAPHDRHLLEQLTAYSYSARWQIRAALRRIDSAEGALLAAV